MKNYINLVNFEVNRFMKIYVVLVVLTIISQVVGAVAMSVDFTNYAQETMQKELLTASQFVEQYWAFHFTNFIYSGWVKFSIVFCIAVLMIYVFFIWYRDWFAKNTFIYRLLMLPTERRTIYFAKLTTIMLFVLGLIGLQIVLVQLGQLIVTGIVPANLRNDLPLHVVFSQDLLYWLYPKTLLEFILLYSIGLLFVAVLFTCILLERSYRLKGIFFAIIYAFISCAVFISPIVIHSASRYFYPLEVIGLEIAAGVIILAVAIGIANHLLKYKIKV